LKKNVDKLPGDIGQRVEYVNGGLECLKNIQNSFDLVCESSVLHHIDDYTSFLQLAHNLLTTKGIIYIGREPLWANELFMKKINLPLYILIQLLDRMFTPKLDPEGSEVVFDENIFPRYEDGGISYTLLENKAMELKMNIIVKNIYNWHTSKEAHFFDSR